MFHERYASINRNLSERLMRKYAGDVIDAQKFISASRELDSIAKQFKDIYEKMNSSDDVIDVQDVESIIAHGKDRTTEIVRELDEIIFGSQELPPGVAELPKPGSSADRLDSRFSGKVEAILELYDLIEEQIAAFHYAVATHTTAEPKTDRWQE